MVGTYQYLYVSSSPLPPHQTLDAAVQTAIRSRNILALRQLQRHIFQVRDGTSIFTLIMALIMLCILPLQALTPPCAHVAFACLSLLLLLQVLYNMCCSFEALYYDMVENVAALKDLAGW